jgi:hypothetical protein
MLSLVLASLLPALAHAATVQTFAPPAACPVCVSGNYTGMSNGSLPVAPVVAGKCEWSEPIISPVPRWSFDHKAPRLTRTALSLRPLHHHLA